MKFTDRMMVDASAIRETDDGLVVHARVARGGNVQDYLGAEIGMAERKIVRVYRPDAEVFDRKAFQTYARKPITIGHPADGVSPETWRDLAVGEIDRDVVRDGEFVSVPLLFRDARTIAMVKAGDGPRELSMGYSAEITMQDGVTPQGEAYDAVMKDFHMNHVAVVALARGGSDLRIGDGHDGGKDRATWGASPLFIDREDVTMADAIKTRTVLIDGLSVETTDAGAQALEKLQGIIAAKDKALADAAAAKAKAEEEAEEEKGKLKAELKQAKDAVLTPEQMRAAVKDRAALEGAAKAISDKISLDLSDADLRKAAVAAKLGDEMVKDASDAEISGMFKAIAKDAKTADPVAAALKDAKTVEGINQVYAERNKSLSDAWMQPAKKEA